MIPVLPVGLPNHNVRANQPILSARQLDNLCPRPERVWELPTCFIQAVHPRFPFGHPLRQYLLAAPDVLAAQPFKRDYKLLEEYQGPITEQEQVEAPILVDVGLVLTHAFHLQAATGMP